MVLEYIKQLDLNYLPGGKIMKKLLIALLMFAMIFAFAACGSDNQDNNDSGNDISEPVASESDISDFDTLKALPKYKGAGEIQYPWEDATSGFWVSGAALSDMQKYGESLVNDGWVLNDKVADYNESENLYYVSADGSLEVQLKLMGDEYIRITMGAPEDIEGLQ